MSTRFSLQPSSVGAAEVVGAEVLGLDPGAEGPVEDEDAIGRAARKSDIAPQGTGACEVLTQIRVSAPRAVPSCARAEHRARSARRFIVRRDLTGVVGPPGAERAVGSAGRHADDGQRRVEARPTSRVSPG